VAGRVVGYHLAAGRAVGIDLTGTLDGLPFTAKDLRRSDFRVRWEDYVRVVDRMERAFGSEEKARRAVAGLPSVVRDLGLLASAFVSPMRLCEYVFTVRVPAMFLNLNFTYEVVGTNEFKVTVEIPPPHSDSPTVLKFAAIAIEVLPVHLALPPSKVVAELSPRRGVYQVTVPASRTLPRRIADSPFVAGVRAVFGSVEGQERSFRRYFEQVARQKQDSALARDKHSADEAGQRLTDAIEAWSLTPREADVLERVARGTSNREIGQSLGVSSKTVEVHVTSLLRKAGAVSRTELVAKLWRSA
jgi:DNA-binding CsgD family transcriptional regulator